MRKNLNIQVGDIVVSTKGYDKGKYYIVKDISQNFVNLVNGKSRPYNMPKKKNLKHIQGFGHGYSVNQEFTIKRIDQEIHNFILNYKRKVEKS